MNVTSNTYSEIYSYLEILGYEFISKLPKKEYNKIIENRNSKYCPKYSINDFSTKLSIEAKCLIVAYHLRYWCETEEEKDKIKRILKDNEEKLKKKYEVFKNIEKNNSEVKNDTNKQLIMIENNSIFDKIKYFIKKIIQRVKNNM